MIAVAETYLDKSHAKICEECRNVFYRDRRCTWKHWARVKFCSRTCAGANRARLADEKRPSMQDKFRDQYVVDPCGCWEWTGLKDKDGYGLMPYAGKMWRANIVSLTLNGRAPGKGQMACHTCDNPPCVNPAHLYPGTNQQNVDDAVSKDRHMRGERSAHAKLTDEDVVAIRISTLSDTAIADKYGVSRSNVTLIRNRRTWKHLP